MRMSGTAQDILSLLWESLVRFISTGWVTEEPRVKVLRQYCLECMGGRKDFVRECKSDDCMIHRYRLGKNPARVGIGNSKVAELRFQLTESIFLQSVGRNNMEKEA